MCRYNARALCRSERAPAEMDFVRASVFVASALQQHRRRQPVACAWERFRIVPLSGRARARIIAKRVQIRAIGAHQVLVEPVFAQAGAHLIRVASSSSFRVNKQRIVVQEERDLEYRSDSNLCVCRLRFVRMDSHKVPRASCIGNSVLRRRRRSFVD